MGWTNKKHKISGIKTKHFNRNLNVDFHDICQNFKAIRSAPVWMKTHYDVSTGTNLPVIAECNNFTHIYCVTVCRIGKKWNKISTFYCSLYSITSIFPLPLLPISILIIFPPFLSLLWSPLQLVTHTPDKCPCVIIPSLYQHREKKMSCEGLGGGKEKEEGRTRRKWGIVVNDDQNGQNERRGEKLVDENGEQ